MLMAVGVFRECWGVKRPQLKNIRRRAQKLGYRYAQLYRIAGNWWVSLAMNECCDVVLGVSIQVDAEADCWILAKHSQGPLLIRWQQSQLISVCQQSLPDCASEFATTETPQQLQCLQYGWLEPLPEPWSNAPEAVLCVREQRLLALEQLAKHPVFRRIRRFHLLICCLFLALLAVMVGVIYWSQPAKTAFAAKASPADKVVILTDRLGLAAVTDILLPAVHQSWQGPWQLQSITLHAGKLRFRYQGFAPLAYQSLQQTDQVQSGTGSAHNLVRYKEQDLSQFTKKVTEQLSPWESDELLRQLLIENRPGLSIKRLGTRWELQLDNWSLSQFDELAGRFSEVPLHLKKLFLKRAALGWSGDLTLTNPEVQSSDT